MIFLNDQANVINALDMDDDLRPDILEANVLKFLELIYVLRFITCKPNVANVFNVLDVDDDLRFDIPELSWPV